MKSILSFSRDPLCQNPWYRAPPWLTALLARRPTKVVAIALANKIARMEWAMMTKSEQYKEPVVRWVCRDLVKGLMTALDSQAAKMRGGPPALFGPLETATTHAWTTSKL
jgi:hypothetical protein